MLQNHPSHHMTPHPSFSHTFRLTDRHIPTGSHTAQQAIRTSMMETAVLDGFRVLEVEDHGATIRLLADMTK